MWIFCKALASGPHGQVHVSLVRHVADGVTSRIVQEELQLSPLLVHAVGATGLLQAPVWWDMFGLVVRRLGLSRVL